MERPADSTWNGFSLAERDRRWSAVRANAARAGLDCVFVPLCVDGRNLHLSLEQARATRSDSRYLTQMENAAVVLPTDGRPPIVVNQDGAGNTWLREARPVGIASSWATAMAAALLDAGMERGRIGVVGLTAGKVTHGRNLNGVVNYSAYAEVLRRLPNATFADATDVVGFARYVKGEEEIACLRRGAAIAAAGIEEMIEAARPGVPAATLYARVMRRMLALGSEYYALALYAGPIGERSLRYQDPPLDRPLQPMYLLTNEVDAVWGGLIAQEMQPILLGPIPEEWKPVIELQREVFLGGLERMKPGTLFGDFVDWVNGVGARRGMRTLTLVHGRGYGDDGPLFTPQDPRGERFRDVPMELGNVWVWKPIAFSADGRIMHSWGGVVQVTESGGELFTGRTPGMVSVR